MANMFFRKSEKDYKGQTLCDPCWNGNHWHKQVLIDDMGRERRTGKKISDCVGGDCQCHCRELMAERHPKPKPDYSQQMTIDVESIQIGVDDKHRDE